VHSNAAIKLESETAACPLWTPQAQWDLCTCYMIDLYCQRETAGLGGIYLKAVILVGCTLVPPCPVTNLNEKLQLKWLQDIKGGMQLTRWDSVPFF
jgi:hypothetical protein